jgi:hypothetical protein
LVFGAGVRGILTGMGVLAYTIIFHTIPIIRIAKAAYVKITYIKLTKSKLSIISSKSKTKGEKRFSPFYKVLYAACWF